MPDVSPIAHFSRYFTQRPLAPRRSAPVITMEQVRAALAGTWEEANVNTATHLDRLGGAIASRNIINARLHAGEPRPGDTADALHWDGQISKSLHQLGIFEVEYLQQLKG